MTREEAIKLFEAHLAKQRPHGTDSLTAFLFGIVAGKRDDVEIAQRGIDFQDSTCDDIAAKIHASLEELGAGT